MEAIIRREIIVTRTTCRVFCVTVSVILMSLGAFVRIPLPWTPVPLTLQTFFVLLSAALLGKGLGVSSQLAYLFLGVMGVPIFSGAGSGMLYLLGPTGGYLVGFVAATLFLSTTLGRAKEKAWMVWLLFLGADVLILSMGTAWLKISAGVSIRLAMAMGFVPFVVGDFIKVGASVYLYHKLRRRVESIL